MQKNTPGKGPRVFLIEGVIQAEDESILTVS
jgi:hypothetical protein